MHPKFQTLPLLLHIILYLGDVVNSSGTIRDTIEDRKNKGFGIVNEILAILDEIPLGRYKMEIGLKLRQAMLLNGMLYNSEAWHAVSEKEVKILEDLLGVHGPFGGYFWFFFF